MILTFVLLGYLMINSGITIWLADGQPRGKELTLSDMLVCFFLGLPLLVIIMVNILKSKKG